MEFCSFASGSAGNCYYIASPATSILIDVGIGPRRLKKNFIDIDRYRNDVSAVLVTHEHYDHTSGVGIFSEKASVPVYTTREIHSAIERNPRIHDIPVANKRFINKEEPFLIGDLQITAFQLYHDSADCVGYFVQCGDSTLAVATDLGHINDEAVRYFLQADNLVLEANYSQQMLLDGDYPAFLKQRILSGNGHLANHVTAQFLTSNVAHAWKHVFFCHLSNNNNTPERVLSDMDAAYASLSISPQSRPTLHTLPRYNRTEVFDL